jgi:hypothetical protein
MLALDGWRRPGGDAVFVGMDAGSTTTRVAVRAADGGIDTLSVADEPHARGQPAAPGLPSLLTPAAATQRAGLDGPVARQPDDVPRDLLAPVRERDERLREPDGVVVAIPDAWSDGSIAGGSAQELLRRVVLERLELPVRRFVGQSAAAAAALTERISRPGAGSASAAPAPSGTALICDVGAHTVTVALCSLDGATARVVDVATSHAPAGQRAGAGFDLRAVRAARAGPADEAVAAGDRAEDAELVDALQTAKHRQQRRAALVLERARTARRYRDAPVYLFHGGPDRYALTADQAIRCFLPVADAIRDTARRLLDRRPGDGDEIVVAVAGGFGSFPLVQEVLLDSLPTSARGEATGPLVLGAAAVARGALLLAEGSAGTPEPYPHSVSLPVYRVHRGRLEPGRVVVARAGEAPPMLVESDGGPQEVEVSADHGLTLSVDVQVDGAGPHRALALPPISLPAGRYHIGLWPARAGFGVMVFRPVGGGEPFVCPLTETTAATEHTGRSAVVR